MYTLCSASASLFRLRYYLNENGKRASWQLLNCVLKELNTRGECKKKMSKANFGVVMR